MTRHGKRVSRRRGPSVIPVPPAPKVAEIGMSVVDVTPEMATQWLEGKVPNRNVSDSLVAKFARDMRARAWHLNGEPIIFGKDNDLMDGQHRLWAVVLAGVHDKTELLPKIESVKMVVIRGVDAVSMQTIDTGRARTFADVLSMREVANSHYVSAAARWLWWYDHVKQGNLTSGGGPSNAELQAALNDHPMVYDAVSLYSARKSRKMLTPAIASFVLTKGLEIDQPYTEHWWEALMVGANLDTNDPVFILREKLNRIPRTGEGRRAIITPMKMAALAIKSWKYGRVGRRMKALDWRNTIENPESFPRFEEG